MGKNNHPKLTHEHKCALKKNYNNKFVKIHMLEWFGPMNNTSNRYVE